MVWSNVIRFVKSDLLDFLANPVVCLLPLVPSPFGITWRVEQVPESHDSLRRYVVDHAVVQPQRGPPLDREELHSLARLNVKPREIFAHHGGDVVAEDVCVPDDRRVVDDLTHTLDDKNQKQK